MIASDGNDNDITRTHTALTKDSLVGHYRIVDKIGAGGMGEVYLADDTKLTRKVALKFLPAHLAQDPAVRARFTREAQAAAKLDHPNIITIHEVGEHNGRPFFAMQYVEGNTLHHFGEKNALPLNKVVAISTQIADGLSKAHAMGVTHRDIKSVNIIVDKELRPRILDFGLATVQGSEMLTRAGSTLGTIAYMSPEQAQGIEVDHRTDLFSFGIVLYELIAGRTPFRRDNDAATLHSIVSDEPEPLARYRFDVSPELQRIVSKCLAKRPEERYQTAADLTADLRIVSRAAESGQHDSSVRIQTLRPSIAVLPFANMSADPENEYFSDGLTEELLNVLARNPELKVTGRTSSFAFKGKQEDLRGIGQKLGVGTLLEGSVRKAGNRVRITAQLVSVADGFHLWSETYDRVLDDIFAVQDDIAKAVANAMHVTLLGKSSAERAVNPESYALVLRAQHSAQQMTKSGFVVAVDLYQQAIDLDLSNARAWAGLSLSLAMAGAYGHLTYMEVVDRSRAAVEKAMTLDPELPEAYLAKAFFVGVYESRLTAALEAYRKAYALAPNSSRVVESIAISEALFGRFDIAVPLSRKAVELDPLNPSAWANRGRVLFWAGQLDESYASLQRATELSPDVTAAHMLNSWIRLLQGRLDESLTEALLEKSAGYRNCALAITYYAMGKKELSDKALSDLHEQGKSWEFQVACAHAYRHEIDEAFASLEKCLELHDAGVPLAKIQPLLKSLHADPRWGSLLARLGLAD